MILSYHRNNVLTSPPDAALAPFNLVSTQQLRVFLLGLPDQSLRLLLSHFTPSYSCLFYSSLSAFLAVPHTCQALSNLKLCICCFLYLECFSPYTCMVCISFRFLFTRHLSGSRPNHSTAGVIIWHFLQFPFLLLPLMAFMIYNIFPISLGSLLPTFI